MHPERLEHPCIINQLKLRAISTIYQSKSYDIWLHPASREGYQLDHFFVPMICAKHDVKEETDGAPINHTVISLKHKLPILYQKWSKEDK